MKQLDLILPWPPSVNGYWRSIARGKYATQILSKKAREYKAAVQGIVGIVDETLPGRLAVTIYLHPPTRRSFDVDNFSKAIFDSLTSAGVWQDDSQIDELTIYRCEIIKGGRAVVKIREI